MTFDEWWKKEHFTPCDFRYGLVKAAWQAATLAERESAKRLRVKLDGSYGSDLDGHWFYLVPVDEYAEAAIRARNEGGR